MPLPLMVVAAAVGLGSAAAARRLMLRDTVNRESVAPEDFLRKHLGADWASQEPDLPAEHASLLASQGGDRNVAVVERKGQAPSILGIENAWIAFRSGDRSITVLKPEPYFQMGLVLDEILRRRGMMQKTLAEHADVDKTLLNSYISGRRMPSPRTLSRIAIALEADEQRLLRYRELLATTPPEETVIPTEEVVDYVTGKRQTCTLLEPADAPPAGASLAAIELSPQVALPAIISTSLLGVLNLKEPEDGAETELRKELQEVLAQQEELSRRIQALRDKIEELHEPTD